MPLPRDDTAFFGRASELAEIARRRAGSRLVTLTGLGGVGKTRLALAAVAPDRDRAVFASVGEARTQRAAVQALAKAFRVRLLASAGTEASDAIACAIAERGAVVLVFDGVEALGELAAKLVTALLDGAPELTILATSRVPLGARGEDKLAIGPLGEDDAIALLRDRAQAAAGEEIAIADADAIAIVRRLDRLPLAVELVAARLDLLSAPQLVARLGELTTAPAILALLDESWALLADVERSALAQACAFAAPFGIEAAEDVVDLDGSDVLEAFEGLVRRSLVARVRGDGVVELALFHTVRAWASAKSPAPLADARARHARWHLAEAERAAAAAYGEGSAAALDRLAGLLPELLVAFAETNEREPQIAARLVVALADLSLFRGAVDLKPELFEAGAEAAARAGDDRLLARALVAKARVALDGGNVMEAERALVRARGLAAEDPVTQAESLRSLGWTYLALGRLAEAEAALLEARALHEDHGSARGLADSWAGEGILRTLQGRSDDALGGLRAALAIHVEHGDELRQEKVLSFGRLAGHDASAIARGLPRDVLARAAPASASDRQRWQQAIALYRRGAAAEERGDLAVAVAHFDDAARELTRAGIARGIAAIHAHAAAALAGTDPAEADARLAKARAASNGSPLERSLVELFAAAVDVLAGRGSVERATALLDRARRAEVASTEAHIAASVLDRALRGRRSVAPAEAALVVGADSRWLVPPGGERIDLTRYGPARRVLERLVVSRLAAPGTTLSADDLIAAGWPGERMRHTAGLLRVYSVVRRLRRLGLDAILVTRDDGYLLDPDASISRARASEV